MACTICVKTLTEIKQIDQQNFSFYFFRCEAIIDPTNLVEIVCCFGAYIYK